MKKFEEKSVIASNNLIVDLLKKWDLIGNRVRSVNIKLEINEVARVEITHFMVDEQAKDLIKVLKKYKIIEIEEDYGKQD